ncbi:hypothetical protein BJX63DRAFT_438581 [Aspergillus granulosus]|uniref:Uncharacterized protein n=1 Tax=Aspergillus granulosus TaxID=176169 RepID=A0ABR4GRZ2_9EURO
MAFHLAGPCMWLACASPTNIYFYPDAFQQAILRVTDQACYRTFLFNVRNPQDKVVYHVNIAFYFPDPVSLRPPRPQIEAMSSNGAEQSRGLTAVDRV